MMISTSAFDRLQVTDPLLSTMRRRGCFSRGVMLAVDRRRLYALVVISPASASGLRRVLCAYHCQLIKLSFVACVCPCLKLLSSCLCPFFTVLMASLSAFVIVLLGGFMHSAAPPFSPDPVFGYTLILLPSRTLRVVIFWV